MLTHIFTVLGLSTATAVSNPPPPDINADGSPDRLVFPSRFTLSNLSPVQVLSGTDGSSLRRLHPADPDGAFGWAGAWTGDADADGLADLVVTEPLAVTRRGLGRAYIISSRTGTVLHEITPKQQGQYGLAVQAVADEDGDGVPDTVVWSRRRTTDGKDWNIRWVFSTRSGEVLSPLAGEDAALKELRSDVNADGAVTLDDAIEIAICSGDPTDDLNNHLDVDADTAISIDDVFIAIENDGTIIESSPPMTYVGWSSDNALLADLSASDDPPIPIELLYAIPYPHPPVIVVDPGLIDDAPGGGGGSGGPGGGGIDDDNPLDPSDNGPSCSPKITHRSRYLCLRPEEPDGCSRIALTAEGGSGTGPYHWTIQGPGAAFLTREGPSTTFNGSSVEVRYCQPGEITVSVTRDASCPLPRVRIFRVVRIDVDIDSDNTTTLSPPDRTIHEELVEASGPVDDTPGKVIKVASKDADNDGLPDRLDGMNLVPSRASDDNSPHVSPTLVIDIAGPMEDNAVLRLRYPASDPSEIRVFDLPPGGYLRMWTVNTSEPRDHRSFLDGGHFVPAGNVPIAALVERLGPPPWTFYVEAADAQLVGIEASVDPDGIDPPLREGDPPGGPSPFLCPDGVQITCTDYVLKAIGCADCEEIEISAFVGTREEHPEELEVPVDFFDRHVLFQVEVQDWRSLESVSVGGHRIPLLPAGSDGLQSDWFYFAHAPHPAAPFGAVRLPPPGPWTILIFNPTEPLINLFQRLFRPHCKDLAKKLKAIVDRARAQFDPTTTDSGLFGKLVHAETAREFASNPRWKSSVWVQLSTRQVVGVGGPPTPHPNTPDFVELDMVYMKGGRTINVGQTFEPDDILDVFEIKTSTSGHVDRDQVERYRIAMNGRKPMLVHPFYKQTASTTGSARWVIAQNPQAMRRARLLGRAAAAAGTGLTLIGAALTIGSEDVDEEVAFDMLLEAVATYRRVYGRNDAEAQLAMLDIVDRMRVWLNAVTGDPLASAVATLTFAYTWMASESWD